MYNFREGVPTGAMVAAANNSNGNGSGKNDNNRAKTSRREQSRKERGGGGRAGEPNNGFKPSAERSMGRNTKVGDEVQRAA